MPLMGLGSLLKTKRLPAPIGPYADLSFWPTINLVYTPRSLRLIRETLADAAEPQRLSRLLHAAERQLGHRIVFAVEAAKIELTAKPATRIDLAFLEQTLEAEATRPTFEEVVRFEMNRLRVAIWSCLAQSGLETEDITAVFLTGGSSLTPIVAQTICAEVPQAQVRRGDDFLSVAMGLTLEAQRRYA